MDHGLTDGPIKGIEKDLGKMVNKIALGGADAVLGHVGIPFMLIEVMDQTSD